MLPSRRRLLALPPRTDAAAAAVLLAVVEMPGFDPYRHGSGFWWAMLGLPAVGALAWRRPYPVAVWAVSTAATVLMLALRAGVDSDALAPLILVPAPVLAVYTVADGAGRSAGRRSCAVTAVALAAGLLWVDSSHPEGAVATIALTVAAAALGESTRTRRESAAAERAERERRAGDRERARLARELHDILAHHIAVIAVHAGSARLRAEAGSTADPAALVTIEETSRAALSELRTVLGALHRSAGSVAPPAAAGPADRSPLPGLDRLDELLDRVRAAGPAVRLTVVGDRRSLPDSVDLAAYRVVQEAVTNVLKHTDAAHVDVAIRYNPEVLDVTVTDDGTAPAPTGGRDGHGLTGLHQRLALHGGRLSAGPLAPTGFRVAARLPLPGDGQ
jgi:signal transduction histidine kinase